MFLITIVALYFIVICSVRKIKADLSLLDNTNSCKHQLTTAIALGKEWLPPTTRGNEYVFFALEGLS